MNPHVEFVRKWLADPESVSQEDLEANADAAAVAYLAADAVRAAAVAAAVAADAVDVALSAACYYDSCSAKKALQRYDELIEKGE